MTRISSIPYLRQVGDTVLHSHVTGPCDNHALPQASPQENTSLLRKAEEQQPSLPGSPSSLTDAFQTLVVAGTLSTCAISLELLRKSKEIFVFLGLLADFQNTYL